MQYDNISWFFLFCFHFQFSRYYFPPFSLFSLLFYSILCWFPFYFRFLLLLWFSLLLVLQFLKETNTFATWLDFKITPVLSFSYFLFLFPMIFYIFFFLLIFSFFYFLKTSNTKNILERRQWKILQTMRCWKKDKSRYKNILFYVDKGKTGWGK